MEMASSFCHTAPHGHGIVKFMRQVPKPCQSQSHQTHCSGGDHLSRMALPPGFGCLNMKGNQRSGVSVKCSAWDTGFLRDLEMELEEGGEGWKRVEKIREKCKERQRQGLVELLECLEREAILGDDHGREPSDYNRRALIFDHSSRVFQALKNSKQS